MAPDDGGASQLRTKIKLPGTGVLTLARPRPTRAKTQKTRTGCRECKRRRIKCDEGRPACQRCISSRRTCDISLNHAVALGDPQDKARHAAKGTTDSRILVEPNQTLSLFKSQQQWDMFSVFLFTNEQAGTMPINTLSAITPQIAQQDIAVREMCCAIGAAANAFTYPNSDPSADKMVYKISLVHYNRALQAVRTAEPTTSALLSVAVAAILFVTYDIMRGDMSTAIAHFGHGHRIINSYFDERCKETGLSFSELKLSSVESAIVEIQQRLTTHPWALDLGFAGSTGSTAGHRLQKRFQPHRHKHKHDVRDMPGSFCDLAEALKWWDVTQQHILLHLMTLRLPESPRSSPSLHSLNSEDYQSVTGDSIAWRESYSTLQSWHARFAPLLHSARQTKAETPIPFLCACTLGTLYLETLTSLHVHQHWDSNVLPDIKPIYLEMIQTTREMQKNYDRPGGAGILDNTLMRPLTFVLYKCHDADVRQEVKEILEKVNENSQMAARLLSMLNRKEGEEVPPKLRNIERSMGWYFTACGCTSGAVNIRQLEALQAK